MALKYYDDTVRDGLAELADVESLIRKSDSASLAEATQLLDQDGPEIEQQGKLFRSTAIRYLIARAWLARALGDTNASVYAAGALEIADETTPSLPHYPDLRRRTRRTPNATDAERDGRRTQRTGRNAAFVAKMR